MEEKKKKFLKPDLEIVDFENDDIITGSGLLNGTDNENWDGDNVEPF